MNSQRKHFDETILSINSTELDYLTAIEGGMCLPIAFKNKEALKKWMCEHDLVFQSIGRRRKVVVVSGYLKPWGCEGRLSYDQIWAAASHDGYRDAIKFRLTTVEGSVKNIHLYDGDHAVSRTRLTDIWPQAWVNMVLVERSLNRSVGAMMEKHSLSVAGGQDRINMNAECIIKTFLRKRGRLTESNLGNYLRECRDRFLKLGKKGVLLREKTSAGDIQEFFMSEHADEFFAEVCRDMNIDYSEVLEEKRGLWI